MLLRGGPGASAQAMAPVNLAYLRAKRGFDIALALVLLCLLSLVMLATAVAIWLDSGGPILYRQRRVGMGGREFEMLKFRSMYVDSDEGVHREAFERYMRGERLNGARDTDNPYKLGNDARITQVGKFIRKTSIDELPQLFNVLAGSMSLVGPRPPIPYEVELYSARDRLRLEGKPGLTGPWQVYGRGHVTFAEMVELDIDYLERQSLWLDIKLIVLTVPVVLHGSGGA